MNQIHPNAAIVRQLFQKSSIQIITVLKLRSFDSEPETCPLRNKLQKLQE